MARGVILFLSSGIYFVMVGGRRTMNTSIDKLIRAAHTHYGVEQWFQIDYTDEDFFPAEEVARSDAPAKRQSDTSGLGITGIDPFLAPA